jgi:protein-S-isoprenylcysteine O-methyltransferase Ste14
MSDSDGLLPMRRLMTRATLQSVAFVALLAFLLLAPAGTLRYWQAWTYVGILVVATTAITAYLLWRDPALLERRLALADKGEQQTRQKRTQAVNGLAFAAMLLLSGLDLRFGWSHVPFVAVIVADLLVAAGFAFVFVVFRENTFTSSVIEVVPKQRVVSTGPYRLVRHPMYAAALLILVATPMALGSWWAEVFVPVLAAGVVLRLLDEERLLAEQLRGYREYMASTRQRLVPFVW